MEDIIIKNKAKSIDLLLLMKLKSLITLLSYFFVFNSPLICCFLLNNKRNVIDSSKSMSSPGLYLERMVERKKIEVNNMLKRHQDPSDKIFMRMTYLASECKYNITNAIKAAAGENSGETVQNNTLIYNMISSMPINVYVRILIKWPWLLM